MHSITSARIPRILTPTCSRPLLFANIQLEPNVAKNAQNESIARPTFERIHTHTSIQHSTHTSTCSIYLFLLMSMRSSTGSDFPLAGGWMPAVTTMFLIDASQLTDRPSASAREIVSRASVWPTGVEQTQRRSRRSRMGRSTRVKWSERAVLEAGSGLGTFSAMSSWARILSAPRDQSSKGNKSSGSGERMQSLRAWERRPTTCLA